MDQDQAASDKVKVLVAYPRGTMTLTEAIDNQMDVAFYMGKLEARSNFKFYFATIGRLFQAKAREEFARYAVEIGCDYLLMIDDDMIVPVDLFERLYSRDVDIVAPLAFQRRKPYFPVIYKIKEGWDEVRREKYFANEIVKNYPKDALFNCDAVGFGAVLIKTKVLAAMPEPRFMSTSPTGEDILFCYNAREQAGARVYCDTSVKIAHLGAPEVITEESFEAENGMADVRRVYGEYDERHYAMGGV